MDNEKSLGFSTRAIHAGQPDDAQGNVPVSPPIHLSADYLFDGVEHYAEVLSGHQQGYAYARFGSPTHTSLHQVVASLEEAESAFSFSSGMAAIHTSLAAMTKSGDHIVADYGVYNTTYSLIESFLPRHGIRATFTEPEATSIAEAIEPETRLVLIDSITTPSFRVADVAGVAQVCAARGIPLVVDNTIATAYLLRPLDFPGVQLVVNSTSKYMGGHSDLIGGCVAGSTELVRRIGELSRQLGSIGGVFEAWLTLRGIQTLALRMARQCTTALALARLLNDRAEVSGVGYAGLPGHRDHERAVRLFGGAGFGAMLSFSLAEGYDDAVGFCRALRLARVGSGFGGVRTEVRHPATTSHKFLTERQRLDRGIGPGLIRVAVGAEDAADLLCDFSDALDRLHGSNAGG
jgi:cystathionine beta-lyase/cystathionine gamma-synthase